MSDRSADEKSSKLRNVGKYYQQNEPDFRRFIRLIQISRMWLFSVGVIAVSLAIFIHILQKKTFLSEAIIAYSASEQKFLPLSSALGGGGADHFLPRVFSLIEEFSNKENCQSMVREIAKVKPGYITGLTFSQICKGITIIPDINKFHLKITATTDTPEFSALLADVAANQLIKVDQVRMTRKLVSIKKFLSKQEQDLGTQLRNLEDEKTQFQAESSLISINQAERTIYDNLERTEKDFFDVQVKVRANEALQKETKKTLEQVKVALVQKNDNTSGLYLSQIQYRLNMLKYRKSMLRSNAKPGEAEQIDAEINDILQVYQNVLDGKESTQMNLGGDLLEYYKTLQQSLSSLERDYGQLKGQLSALSGNRKTKGEDIKFLASNIQRFGEISREIDVTNNLYLMIKKRLQEIEIEEVSSVSDFSLLRRADTGISNATPIYVRVAFYLAIALFLCVALVLFRDSFIPSIKNQNELIEMGIFPLGYIPVIPVNPLTKMPILIRDYPHSIEADAFRALRLKVMGLRTKLRKGAGGSLLITSPRPASGKSFIATNLAYALAKSGVKTLLVDMDLRRPSVWSYFNEGVPVKSIEHFIETNDIKTATFNVTANLDIIVPENPFDNPAEKIEEIKLAELMKQANEQYDFVILDMPPSLSVIDPLLVATHVDFSLLVVEHRKTHKEDILNACHQLNELSAGNMLGIVNMVFPEMISADGGRYYKVMSAPRKKAS